MNKYLKTVLVEMCKIVDANFDEINFKENDWYLKYSWPIDEQNNFKKWFINYLYDSARARKNIMSNPIKNKKYIEKFVDMFLFNYGWKTDDEK